MAVERVEGVALLAAVAWVEQWEAAVEEVVVAVAAEDGEVSSIPCRA
jgi:hypothetical protein